MKINIKLLCYDINLLPPALNPLSSEYKDFRFATFQDHLLDYDIVALQELYSRMNDRKLKLIEEADKMLLRYSSEPTKYSTFSGYLLDSGLLNLSKFQIINSEFIPFRYSAGKDAYVYKGILYSKIQVAPRRHIHLFNLFLQNSGDDQKSQKKNIQARLNQISSLRSIIDITLNNNSTYATDEMFREPILVTGQFNVNANSPQLTKNNSFKLHNKVAQDWIEKNGENQDNEKEGFSEYEFLKQNLGDFGRDECIDFAHEAYGFHAPTYGASYQAADGQILPKETILTPKGYQIANKCTSFIFQILPQKNKNLKLNATARMQPFYTDTGKPVSQLSPHNGIELEFKFKLI